MQGFFPSSTLVKNKPASMVPRCGACGLLKTSKTPKMDVFGKGLRGVLVVGEAPGETEDDESRPFVGKAGQYLRDTLEEFGFDLDRDAWTTNALICRPPGNKTPDAKQIDYCRPNLVNTIAQLQPTVILTLGRVALTSVMHDYWDNIGTMERWTGWKIPMPKHWICPTYHPSFLLRSRNGLMDRYFANDVKRAFSIKKAPPAAQDFKSQIECLYDEREIYEAIRQMDREGGWAAVDYEGNCLKPEYPKAMIRSCCIANEQRCISYPWHGKAIEATGMFLRSKRTRKIASNLKHEERWTRWAFGHGVTNWGWDTMLASHVLDNRLGICSLKFQALVKLGVAIYNEHIDPYLTSNGHYNQIQEIAIEDLLFYGGMDGVLELQLAKIQRMEMGFED